MEFDCEDRIKNSEDDLRCDYQDVQDSEIIGDRDTRMAARRERVLDKYYTKRIADATSSTRFPILEEYEEIKLKRQNEKSTKARGSARLLTKDMANEALSDSFEENRKRLQQILLEGETYITDVKVEAQDREKKRLADLKGSGQDRIEKLEKESLACDDMYKVLSDNWVLDAEKALPVDMAKLVKKQKDDHDALLLKKDIVISSLRLEIGRKDIEHEQNMKQYQTDIITMGDRIEDHMQNVRSTFVKDFRDLETNASSDWKSVMKSDSNTLSERITKMEEYEARKIEKVKTQIGNNQINAFDFYMDFQRETKIDVQNKQDLHWQLVHELEAIKIALPLNHDKLKFNYPILQSRVEQNEYLVNTMKRRNINYQDELTCKTRAYEKLLRDSKKETNKLLRELEILERHCAQAEQKSLQHLNIENKKYKDIWKISEDEARTLLEQLLITEGYICESHLGANANTTERDLSVLDERPLEVEKNLSLEKKRTTDDFKYPSDTAVTEYWERYLVLADATKKDIWESVQWSTEQYTELLKKRNNLVTSSAQLCQQNQELTKLLMKVNRSDRFCSDPKSMCYLDTDYF